jgi:hypothetical protein
MSQPNEKIDVIVDYAKPCMDAERALKNAHNAVLAHKLDAAMEFALLAVVNARMMYTALTHMKEQNG